MKKTILALLCALTVFFCAVPVCSAENLNGVIEDTAAYLLKETTPAVGSVGGDWAAFGLVRSEQRNAEEYLKKYAQTAEEYVKECGGILHERKYTEYSRMIITLTAVGKNPENVGGYNLLTPLGDYEKTVWQGINGSIWALIALDSGNYEMPVNTKAKLQATRQMYMENILNNQKKDGGWAFSGDTSDPDVTAMALLALSKYTDTERVKEAVLKALSAISEMQNEDGGFSSGGVENAESCAQIITALCELKIPLSDERFVKNGNDMLSNLLEFYIEGKGFKHIKSDDETNQMATEQCFYALVALKRMNEGKISLFTINNNEKEDIVKKLTVVNYGKTFDDINNSEFKTEIEELAARGVLNGKEEKFFKPQDTVTRAEFAKIITAGLGLKTKEKAANFIDVEENSVFCEYINTAYFYGIAKGVSQNEFNPNGTITRKEAAVILKRVAELCKINAFVDEAEEENILLRCADGQTADGWAKNALAFCINKEILPIKNAEIMPNKEVTRAETAHMLFSVLLLAELI